MKLVKWFKFTFLLSLLALVYIHMQMQIIDLAYQGKEKEQSIRLLNEVNGHIQYEIASLKSAYHLGETVLAENDQMQFADKNAVIPIITVDNESGAQTAPEQLSKKKPSGLLNLVSRGFSREARAQE